jgi:hypothetical protein
MTLILLLACATGLGWWLGSRPALGKTAFRVARPVMLGALGLLLFSMGLSLGSRPELVAGIGMLGLKALITAWSGAAGAILAVWLTRRALRIRNGKAMQAQEAEVVR